MTVIQRFDSALRLNIHFHTLVLDGVYVKNGNGEGLRLFVCLVRAIVPPPRLHMVRFHGVLAPNSALREQVVASALPYVPSQENTVPNPVQLPLLGQDFEEPEVDVKQSRRKPWACLLRHVFAIDVNDCPKCARPMKWRQVALTADAICAGEHKSLRMTQGGVHASMPEFRGYFS